MNKILIVDDSEIMRKSLKNIVSEAGYEVVGEAVNGEEAIRFYDKLEPNIVTMDLNMPGLDGVEVVKLIIEKDPEAKIIMVSGIDHKSKIMNALKSGAKYYIIKPYDPSAVLNVIKKILHE